jgi:transposase
MRLRCRIMPPRGKHRLNRFGDRALNRAVHTIVNWRMTHGLEPTQHYLTWCRAEQKSGPEIRRRVKRYAARQLLRRMESATRSAAQAITTCE